MGSFNNWEFSEMTKSQTTKGLNSFDVGPFFWTGTIEFQIVRNKDRKQAFFPQGLSNGGAVSGPDDSLNVPSWRIEARIGETYRVEFQRRPGCGGQEETK